MNLFPHQQQALDLTAAHNRCAYYLDMGLGKTFVGSEKLMGLQARINLVVCQHSKIQDWIEHFKTHYSDVAVVDMTVKGAVQTVLEWGYGMPVIGVINYELTFRRKILKSLTGFTLMLDESSLIQNETAKRSKFILGLKPDNVILLSGTPTGGKYEKLWSQCQLLGWNISKDLFWKQYVETEWVEDDGFWRQRITGYKNVDRLKKKLTDHGAVFMTTDDAGIELPTKNMIQVKTKPSPLYYKFRKKGIVSIDTGNLGEFELDSDFWGSNEHVERELIGDTSLTRRLYSRQLCGLYNPARYEAFRDLVNSTDDRLIVFYNFTEEMERMRGVVRGLNRPVSVLNGETKDLTAYNYKADSVTFIQYQAGAMGGNFQKANKIIYFSLPEGWELWEQSQKRIHRIGQERPCFYYLLICPGTVEEDILATLNLRKDYNDELFRKYEAQA
jgi:SNF2 family DNA or RNA helicase|nr:DEAD/DEAH box helicase [uncultured Oscillibacter sp.]